MKYEIYIDTLFMTNFIMDFIALWIVNLYLKRKQKIKRLICASIFCTTISILLFLILHNYIIYQIIVHIFINPIMIWFGYNSKKIKKILIECILVYMVLFLLGGMLDFTFMHLGKMKGYWVFVSIITIVILISLKIWEQLQPTYKQKYEVTLHYKVSKSDVLGFYDTGNLLKDPFVNKPVHIVEQSYIDPIIKEYDLPIRYIPYHSLGTQNGLLPVVTLDYMYIKKEKESIYIEKPVCGIAKDNLFQNNMCQILLNAHTDI